MNKVKFFEYLRKTNSGVFSTRLNQAQVDGIEAILDACYEWEVFEPHHIANVLAQVYHETGRHMLPIKETVMPHHTNKNPSDQTVINRLNNAFAKGQLTWVRTPYWREGWFGRGPIQITHKTNYKKMGDILGVDLVGNRDLALDPKIGALIAVAGMKLGTFTGKGLSDYRFPSSLSSVPSQHPRRIVNGVDGTDDDIRKYHMGFYNALMYAGYTEHTFKQPQKPTDSVSEGSGSKYPETTEGTTRAPLTLLGLIINLLKLLFSRK